MSKMQNIQPEPVKIINEYTAIADLQKPDTGQIHVNLTDQNGNVVFEQWELQSDWDADKQAIEANMIDLYTKLTTPPVAPVVITESALPLDVDTAEGILTTIKIEKAASIQAEQVQQTQVDSVQS